MLKNSIIKFCIYSDIPMQNALDKTYRECPFNNATELFSAAQTLGVSIVPPDNLDRMGGSCRLQVNTLANNLIADGVREQDIQYLQESVGYHWVNVVETEGRTFFVDTTANSFNPIDITPLVNGESQEIIADAYPVVDGNPTKLVLKVEGQGGLRYSRHLYRPTSAHYQLIETKCYGLKNKQTLRPPVCEPRRAVRDQDVFRMDVVETDSKRILGVRYRRRENRFSAGVVGLGMHDEMLPQFECMMDEIAARISASTEDIRRSFQLAYHIYDTHLAIDRGSSPDSY